MTAILRKLNSPPDRLLYWAIFRVYLSFHLINQIVSYFFLRDVLFTQQSFVPVATFGYIRFFQEHIIIFFVLYASLVIAMALGVGRHFTVVAVFIATKSIQLMNGYILNGGHNFLTFLLLYMCFANSFEYLVLHKAGWRNPAGTGISNYLTNLATYSVIIHLSLVYLVSGLAKAHAEVWYSGDAMYYILNIERFQGLRLNAVVAKSGILVTLVTYTVMLWELYFPAIVWIPKLRGPVLIAGVFMHIGIWFSMMIYDFEVLFIMTYGFFFRDSEIIRFRSRAVEMLGQFSKSRMAKL